MSDNAAWEEIKRKLNHEVKERLETAVSAGLYAVANNVMTEAKERCPTDTGALKNSGYVTLPQKGNHGIELEMGFGGPAESYAIVQHEDTSLNHPDGGEAKFLEKSIDAQRPNMLQLLTQVARKAFNRNSATMGVRAAHATGPWDTMMGQAQAMNRRFDKKRSKKP